MLRALSGLFACVLLSGAPAGPEPAPGSLAPETGPLSLRRPGSPGNPLRRDGGPLDRARPGGSMGLVVNRPTEIPLHRALDEVEETRGSELPVYWGRPRAARGRPGPRAHVPDRAPRPSPSWPAFTSPGTSRTSGRRSRAGTARRAACLLRLRRLDCGPALRRGSRRRLGARPGRRRLHLQPRLPPGCGRGSTSSWIACRFAVALRRRPRRLPGRREGALVSRPLDLDARVEEVAAASEVAQAVRGEGVPGGASREEARPEAVGQRRRRPAASRPRPAPASAPSRGR